MSMNRSFSFIGIMSASCVAVAASLCSAAAQSPPDKRDDVALPDGPGKAIIQKSCLQCHTASVIITKPGHTDDEWADILNQMVGRGAVFSDEDGDALMQYLSKNFGPSWKGKPSASPTAGAVPGAGTTAQPSEAQPANAAGASAGPATVNVNKASAQELEAALGITASEAGLIVRHREQDGNYKTWEDVSSVPGVPAETIKKNQKLLTF
jgi:competence protein ComEA